MTRPVQGIISGIAVTSRVTATDVRAQIEDAF